MSKRIMFETDYLVLRTQLQFLVDCIQTQESNITKCIEDEIPGVMGRH